MKADIVRQELVQMLRGGVAHVTFDDVMKSFPFKWTGVKPAGCPHTAWQLLEHLRIAQQDIIDFTRNVNYVELQFPADYWPPTEAPPDESAWKESVTAFQNDIAEMEKIIQDESNDLLARFPHGTGQSIFREAFVLAEHNSYHLGQLMLLRRMLESL